MRIRSGSRRTLVALVGAMMVAAGCGSNHSDKELAATLAAQSTGVSAAAPTPGTDGGGAASAATSSPETPVAAGLTAVPSAGGVAVSVTPSAGKTSSGSATGAVPATGTAGAAPPAGTSPKAAGAPSAGSATASPAPGTPKAPEPTGSAGKSTIVLGTIGTDSGVLGEILKPISQTQRAWVADVNARGGLNGHPVKLIFGDDAGDPGKALSLARRMVDQDGVIAFYVTHGPGTSEAIASFLEERKIPQVGACGCDGASSKSPMMFNVGPSADPGVAWAHMLGLVALSDKRKVSILYCRETPGCKAGRDAIIPNQKLAGIQVVHEAQITVSQPDYTGEMLAARNAGADAVIILADNASIIRIARSAHRQNYTPVISGQWATEDERFLATGGEDIEGTVLGSAFPYWESPKLADYVGALNRYVPGSTKGGFGMFPWPAGKMLEVIAKGFPERPTKDDILKGLYAVNGETLGGLVPPLTYLEGQASNHADLCVIPMAVQGGKFVAKNGDAFTCAPGWQPQHK